MLKLIKVHVSQGNKEFIKSSVRGIANYIQRLAKVRHLCRLECAGKKPRILAVRT